MPYIIISNKKRQIQFNLWGKKKPQTIFSQIHFISVSSCSIYQIILLPFFHIKWTQCKWVFIRFLTILCVGVLHIPYLILLMKVCHSMEISVHWEIVNFTFLIVRFCCTVNFAPNFWPTYPNFELKLKGFFFNPLILI